MKILALDTSTNVASAAVLVVESGGDVVFEKEATVSTHSERLLPLIDEVLAAAGLKPADLDLIACGAGPGSFTGLRIGLATAKGICFALGKPLVVASSLAALAMETAGGDVLAILDARRNEVYAGLYRITPAGVSALAEERVLPPADLSAYTGGRTVVVVGDGALAYPEAAARAGSVQAGRVTPRAAHVARLALARHRGGAADEVASSTPTYIRPSEAEIKADKK